ncbi:hypothetical protein CEXT_541511 [Caerostris extrusa]|uniref:Uncharacterized protein n=1 Tax=Caerostris extrusa TaxID=172846 RepID=A0AAV4UMT1_CAEEX|nr:hypothetical protein CEXT_541511 [Caerostris extrusa]
MKENEPKSRFQMSVNWPAVFGVVNVDVKEKLWEILILQKATREFLSLVSFSPPFSTCIAKIGANERPFHPPAQRHSQFNFCNMVLEIAVARRSDRWNGKANILIVRVDFVE